MVTGGGGLGARARLRAVLHGHYWRRARSTLADTDEVSGLHAVRSLDPPQINSPLFLTTADLHRRMPPACTSPPSPLPPSRPALTYAARVHLAAFYCYGVNYQLSHRVAGIAFVSTSCPMHG